MPGSDENPCQSPEGQPSGQASQLRRVLGIVLYLLALGLGGFWVALAIPMIDFFIIRQVPVTPRSMLGLAAWMSFGLVALAMVWFGWRLRRRRSTEL